MKKLIIILGCIVLGCYIFTMLLGDQDTSFKNLQKEVFEQEESSYSTIP
ncbi:hypothetical protein JYG23_12420 [Sedimentibacter sp. zth1]|nr:hypothetical protein [Sedimentibacter sp. zth1]QSX05473.1 hypothetical protein JYG23_12420 [Sedimentibacter sp. zth1]